MRREPVRIDSTAWWGLVYVVLVVALATVGAWPIYQTERLALLGAAAAVLGPGAILAGRYLRWRWWQTTIVAVVLYLLAAVGLAVPSALTGPLAALGGAGDAVVGLVVGWKQILTLELPLGDYQAVLVPFFAVVYAGAVIASALIVRGGRAAAVAAPIAVLMAAFGPVFGASATSEPLQLGPVPVPAPRELAVGLGLLVLSIVWLVGRGRLDRARALRLARARTGAVQQRRESFAAAARRNVLGGAIVVIALAAGLLVAPAASGLADRTAWRDQVDPSLVVQRQASPLAAYRSWFTADAIESELFTVSGDTETVGRLRLATLDDYDGHEFHVAADGAAGRFDRLPTNGRVDGADAQLEITVGDGLEGVWTPVPEGLRSSPAFAGPRAELLADSFYVSADRATAVTVTDAAGDGLVAGDRYSVWAPAGAGAAELSGSGGESLVDPETHPALAAWVEQQQVGRTAADVVELVGRLVERGYLTHSVSEDAQALTWVARLTEQTGYAFESSYSGHSAARTEELFASLSDQQQRAGEDAPPEALVAAPGDDEQFATAAALVARYLGFESRVAIGVRLGETAPAGVPACADVCTGENVTAWAEVRSASGDWAALASTPQFAMPPSVIAEGEELPQNPTVPQQESSDPIDPPEALSEDAESAPLTDEQEEQARLAQAFAALRLVALVLAVVALVLLPVIVLAVGKLLRRRGRRAAVSPEVSIVGAWEELIDTYTDARIAVPRDGTRLQIAAELGRPRAVQLAQAVDVAVFGEHPPGPEQAHAAWSLLDAERSEVLGQGGARAVLRHALSPASFLRRLDSGTGSTAGWPTARRKEALS